MEHNFDIQEELKKLPAKPGVYLMHDDRGEVLYVGKAISLKNRVRQYFQSSKNKGLKIERMVTQISYFEYIVTDTELEALVLECNLIKEHRPKYNTMLMDDKAYPFIKVTVEEAYPRIMLARKISRDKSRYFGPYRSVVAVRETIELVEKLYKIRDCNRRLPRDIGKERPCLNYQIQKCAAPCQGYISQEDYNASIQEVIRFLNGYYDGIQKDLKEKMETAAAELKFERAGEYRDLLNSVNIVAEKQKITDGRGLDKDVLALAMEETDGVVQVFFIREGRLIGREHFYLKVSAGDAFGEVLASFIKQYYGGTPFVPTELMLQVDIPETQVIEEWLGKKRGGKVNIKVPQKGSKEKLVEMAKANAELVLQQDKERLKREEAKSVGAVREIERLLDLKNLQRLEAFDISNLAGYENVGSMVVYEGGKPKRNDYRRFKIKAVSGMDDYASLKEVLSRRFSHGLKERESDKEIGGFSAFPDLILMDGGKGQVNVAVEVLKELDLNIPVCGMVKDDKHQTRGLYYQNKEMVMDTHSEGFRLITRIQDEAHRFAITFHRQLRSKTQVRSILDDITGIGPSRRKALLGHFKHIEAIRKATLEELQEAPGMNVQAAKNVLAFFEGKT